MSRLVPVHNPHPGGTYIWFTVPDDPDPEMERTVTTAPGPQAGTGNEPVPYSLTPAAEVALAGSPEIEAAFAAAEENYGRQPGTAARLLASYEIDNAEAVPLDASIKPTVGKSNDVPRKFLSEEHIRNILETQYREIQASLAEYQRLEKHTEAAQLQAELDVLAPYLKDS